MDADKCAGKVDEGKKWKYTCKTETHSRLSVDRRLPQKTRTTERFASRHYDGSRKKGEKPRNDFNRERERERGKYGELIKRVDRILRTDLG